MAADKAKEPARVSNVDRTGGKRKYTRGTKPVQEFGRAVNRGLQEVADAVATGVSEYQDRSEASADERRDGMIRDFPENFTYGVGKVVEGAAMAPYEMARIFFARDDDDDE